MGVTFSFNSMDMNDTSLLEESISKYIFSNSGLIWPTPGYTTITSYFGYRKSPISGASSYHNGIDIGAPSGSEIIAAFSGQVTYIGFYGAGGYTVQISDGYYTANYSHISPHFLVYVNQAINQGDVIATVGTINFDYRSLYHHFENGCLLYKCDAIKDIKADFEDTFSKCVDVSPFYNRTSRKALKASECIYRLFAPML